MHLVYSIERPKPNEMDLIEGDYQGKYTTPSYWTNGTSVCPRQPKPYRQLDIYFTESENYKKSQKQWLFIWIFGQLKEMTFVKILISCCHTLWFVPLTVFIRLNPICIWWNTWLNLKYIWVFNTKTVFIRPRKSVSDLFFSFRVGREMFCCFFHLWVNSGDYENLNKACHIKYVVASFKMKIELKM